SCDVVRRCYELGAKVITFGGGDPFKFAPIERIVELAHSLGLEIQIDTNAISLTPRHYPLLTDYVSLLGLPLDGPAASIHDSIRSAPGHFEMIQRHLAALQDRSLSIKINTVVTALNSAEVPMIAPLLNEYPSVQRWSLYQFWPLERGRRYERDLN